MLESEIFYEFSTDLFHIHKGKLFTLLKASFQGAANIAFDSVFKISISLPCLLMRSQISSLFWLHKCRCFDKGEGGKLC